VTQRRRGRRRSPKRSAGYQLIESGRSDAEIAERLGVSRRTIGRWRRERGVPPLKPGRPEAAPAPARRHRSARKPISPEVAGAFGILDAAIAYAAQQPRRTSVSRRLEASDENSVALGFYPGARVSGAADVDPDELAAAGL